MKEKGKEHFPFFFPGQAGKLPGRKRAFPAAERVYEKTGIKRTCL